MGAADSGAKQVGGASNDRAEYAPSQSSFGTDFALDRTHDRPTPSPPKSARADLGDCVSYGMRGTSLAIVDPAPTRTKAWDVTDRND